MYYKNAVIICQENRLPLFEKIQPLANPPEVDPNLPKCSIPRQKNNVDNKTRFSYQEGYCLC